MREEELKKHGTKQVFPTKKQDPNISIIQISRKVKIPRRLSISTRKNNYSLENCVRR